MRQAWREMFCLHHYYADGMLVGFDDWGNVVPLERCERCGLTRGTSE
jgi:hypothetical protein